MSKKSWLGIFVLSILAISLFVGFAHDVNAADPAGDWINEHIVQPWNKGEGLGEGFSRILFGIIIAVLVYSVADRLPGLNKKELTWARWVISIIVGYFGTAYLIKGELMALISSYSALGFTLAFILPFLILIFFSYDLALSKNIKNLWIKRLLIRSTWLIFGAFSVYRLIDSYGLSDVSPWISLILWLFIAVSLGFAIFSGWLIKRLAAGETETTLEKLHEESQLVRGNRRAHLTEAGAGG